MSMMTTLTKLMEDMRLLQWLPVHIVNERHATVTMAAGVYS